jgi:hypothetical protein
MLHDPELFPSSDRFHCNTPTRLIYVKIVSQRVLLCIQVGDALSPFLSNFALKCFSRNVQGIQEEFSGTYGLCLRFMLRIQKLC